MATNTRSSSTRSGTIQSYKKLVRRANILQLHEVVFKKLLGIFRARLKYLTLNHGSGEVDIPHAHKVKKFIKQSLQPPSSLFSGELSKMPLMPMMVLKERSDLYGCGTPLRRIIEH